LSRVQQAIVQLMQAELDARPEWDEVPQLYRLMLRGGEPALVPLSDTNGYWLAGAASGLSPVETLAHFAMTMALVAQRHGPPDGEMPSGVLHGMAFRHEGWHVETHPADKFATRRAHQLAEEHQLKRHPAREEVRIFVAVDRASITYQAMTYRSGAHEPELVIMPRGGQAEATGTVPDSLDLMVSTLCGVPLLPRTEYRP
jgi:hypothetical protein